jgi:hypothetical protein
MMKTHNLATAKDQWQEREGVEKSDSIKAWESGADSPKHIADLPSWAEDRGIDAVIWTALLPKFQFSVEERPI